MANVWQGEIVVTNSREEHSQVGTVMMVRLFRCKRELRKRGKVFLLDLYHRGKEVEGDHVGKSKRRIGSPRSIDRMEASFRDHVRGKVLGHCVMELGT